MNFKILKINSFRVFITQHIINYMKLIHAALYQICIFRVKETNCKFYIRTEVDILVIKHVCTCGCSYNTKLCVIKFNHNHKTDENCVKKISVKINNSSRS